MRTVPAGFARTTLLGVLRPTRSALFEGLSRRLSSEVHSQPGSPPGPLAVEAELRRFGMQRVRPWLAHALASSDFERPSPIQAAVMPAVAKHRDVVIHAATGSGKTLAYLVPLLSRLEPGRPLQMLVLVPSRELALQVATQIDQLIHSPSGGDVARSSGLNVLLLVGGLGGSSGLGSGLSSASQSQGSSSPRPADPVALRLHGELLRAITRCRADVVVATPSALLKALRLDEERSWQQALPSRMQRSHFNGRGGKLLLQLAKSLDVVVLDEVDALMPKPIIEGAQFYAKADWKFATREQRKRARHKGGDAWSLLRMLSKGMAAIRRKSRGVNDRKLGRDRAGRQVLDVQRAYKEMREDRACFQLVAASATVSRAMVGHLMRVLPLPERPEVLTAKHTEASALASESQVSTSRRGPGGVSVPRAIRHLKAEVVDDESKAAATSRVLHALSPRTALVVMPDAAPIRDFVSRLRHHGVPHAMMLHEALGFPARGGGTGKATDAQSLTLATPPLLRRWKTTRFADRQAALAALNPARSNELGNHEGIDVASLRSTEPPVVLVTTEASCRGLDLPGLDCVLLLYCPLTSDTYTHLAGRTGRGRAEAQSGTVVSLLTSGEMDFLGLFTRQLRISIKSLKTKETRSWPFAVAAGTLDSTQLPLASVSNEGETHKDRAAALQP